MDMLKKIQNDLATQKSDMRNMEENIKKEINGHIDEKFTTLEQKTISLEKRIDKQQVTIERLERQIKKKNLLFFGVEESESSYFELLSTVLDILNNNMKINCQQNEVETVRRLGKKGEKVRPIVVTMTTMGRKIEILKKKKMLENSTIYIKEDLTQEALEKRRQLQEEYKKLRDSGKNVAIRYDKIIYFDKKDDKNYRDYDNREMRTQKRNLSESPEAQYHSKTLNQGKNIKQVPKKNKTNDITSYITNSSSTKHSNQTPNVSKNDVNQKNL